VAGFSFRTTFELKSEQLTRDLLTATQRRGRTLGLEVRYRRLRHSGRTWMSFDVTVDGPLVRMEALLEQLALELPAFAEGARGGELPPRERIDTAWYLIEACDEGMRDIRASIFRLHDALAGSMPVTIAAPLSYVFDPGPATHLAGRLRDLTRTLGLFRLGYVSPEQAIEEVHTAAESVLSEAVGRSGSFAERAMRAHEVEYLSHELYADLIDLKDRRKYLKHRGQSIDDGTAVEVVNLAVRAIQTLLHVIAQRP
jgi:hypothetical protein